MQVTGTPAWTIWLGGAVTVAVVFAIRWRQVGRVRPLRLGRLWVLPAVLLALTLVVFAEQPPRGTAAWVGCVVALAIGGALGWQRGRMMRIALDPETHTLNHAVSAAAMLFLLALIGLRLAARAMLGKGNALGLDAAALTDMLVVMALGLFTVQRVEMWLRARRLLAGVRDHRTG